MKAEELLHAGRVEEALAALQDTVRNNAADATLRVFLFQILSVLGQWKRALTQLDVLAGMGSEQMMMARIFRPVVECEILRSQVFAGKHTPIVFGEPAPWIGLLVQANELVAQGKFVAAQELRDKAFEDAPAASGKLNGHDFEWIADADLRLGPILEAMVEGHYYWIPFARIKRLFLEPPSDLRDLVWAPAQFVWDNGGEASGHIPTRYPGTEQVKDSALLLARKTEWTDHEGGYTLGRGQRLLATNAEEYPLLECRSIDFNPAT
jgi:type VI secretion system protein ImpE